MSATFKWDPDSTQTYNSTDGTQTTPPSPAIAFNKNPGMNFTMNALAQSFTLLVQAGGSGANESTVWQQSTITINDGTLIYDNTQSTSSDASLHLAAADLILNNKSSFKIQYGGNFPVLEIMNDSSVTLNQTSNFYAGTLSGCIFSGKISLLDSSVMNLCMPPGGKGIVIFKLNVSASGDAKYSMLFPGPDLHFDNVSGISQPFCTFALQQGNPVIEFSPSEEGGEPPFNFLSSAPSGYPDYPKGLFRFDKGSKGKFRFSGKAMSDVNQFTQMVKRELIYIDGQAAAIKDLNGDYRTETDVLTITLR